MRKPKIERMKDIKAKKAFNKEFSKLNELERLKLLGLDPRDAFKIAKSKLQTKVEKKIIDATKFYENLPEDFFDSSRMDMGWLRNKLMGELSNPTMTADIINAIHYNKPEILKKYDDFENDEIYNIILEYKCYRIALKSLVKDSNQDIVITEEMKSMLVAYFSYIYNSMNEPNHYSHNGIVLENILASQIYENRNGNGEVQVDLSQLMNAEIHNNGKVEAKISKMDILKFIQANDELFVNPKECINSIECESVETE